MRNSSGFTLIELLVTLTVAAILLTVAVPGFQSLIRGNRMATEANNLHAALVFSRSEALKRRGSVTLCRSADGTSCGGSWGDGWIVFDDADADGALDAGEQRLRVGEALPGSVSAAVAPAATAYLRFDATGRADNGVAPPDDQITLTLTPSDCPTGQPGIRDVTVSATGHAAVREANCP